MIILVPLMCLLGMGVALFPGYARDVPAESDDVPVRLLRWAVGLLAAQREEWGQAMLGELGHVDGRVRRWRFAAGCAGAALLMPPWGRAAAAVWAMAAVAAGCAALYAFACLRYGLEAGDWALAAIALVFLAGYALVACPGSCCVRRARRPAARSRWRRAPRQMRAGRGAGEKGSAGDRPADGPEPRERSSDAGHGERGTDCREGIARCRRDRGHGGLVDGERPQARRPRPAEGQGTKASLLSCSLPRDRVHDVDLFPDLGVAGVDDVE
jgi:hypothetical protein